jgi:tetratricopeptide (TPR) repeat protein
MNPNPPELEWRYGIEAQKRWNQFIRHLELREGFSFVVLLVPDSTAARLTENLCRQWLETKGLELVSKEYTDPAKLKQNLAPFLLEQIAVTPNLGAVWVSGVVAQSDPDQPDWSDAWRYAAARINERREQLTTRYAIPIVLVGAPWLQIALREAAPDWWSVRSLVVNLKKDLETRVPNNQISQEIFLNDSTVENLDPDEILEQAMAYRTKGQEQNLLKLLRRTYDGLFQRNRWEEALEIAKEMLEIEEKINISKINIGAAYHHYGVSLYKLGHYKEAQAMFKKALDLAKDGSSSYQNIGIITGYLGRVYRHFEQFEKAENAYQEAFDWFQKAPETPELLRHKTIQLLEFSRLYRSQFLLSKSEETIREALEIASKTPNFSLSERAIVMRDLGDIQRSQFHLEEAENSYRTALTWQEQDQDSLDNRGDTMAALGHVLNDMGRYEEAKETFITALEWQRLGGSTLQTRYETMKALGKVLQQLNDPTAQQVLENAQTLLTD